MITIERFNSNILDFAMKENYNNPYADLAKFIYK